MLSKLYKILEKTFPNEKIPKKIEKLEINSFKSWDSLGSMRLLLNIEKAFKIKLNPDQLSETHSIKEIIKILKEKKKNA